MAESRFQGCFIFMVLQILLALWSCTALFWWIISWRLVVLAEKSKPPHLKPHKRKFLSIFKPLPLLENQGLKIEARGLESFIAQLDDESELLLGVHESDWPQVMPFVKQMGVNYPRSRVVVARRTEPDTMANPKVAWQKLLIPQAKGELWLWSDADIVAPPDFLEQARAEFETCGAELLTFPYTVRSLTHSCALLDALFVNTEFYPGVLFLRRLGPVDFGLGSAMLFNRDSFLRKTNWEELGISLADDFMLGQILQPVRLGSITLETVAEATDWRTALAHYFRWKKTICWCRPVGFAAQVVALPLLGWIGFVAWNPGDFRAWLGLGGMIQIDVFFAFLICRKVGCPIPAGDLFAVEAWSLFRVLFWILCWFPGRIKWRDKHWKHAHKPV
jgi:hypothetical protein